MIYLTLAPTHITTAGDENKLTFVIDRSVAQESPLSPALFKIFIDVLAEMIAERLLHAIRPNMFFADDLKLTAENPNALQSILNTISQWAENAGMTWNTKKSWVIRNHVTEGQNFYLAGVERVRFVSSITGKEIQEKAEDDSSNTKSPSILIRMSLIFVVIISHFIFVLLIFRICCSIQDRHVIRKRWSLNITCHCISLVNVHYLIHSIPRSNKPSEASPELIS